VPFEDTDVVSETLWMVSPLSEVANQLNMFQMPMIDFQMISADPRLPLAHQVSLSAVAHRRFPN
jgi:hypothetical protein